MHAMKATRNSFLPFALPSIGEAEIAEVVDSMRSGWLTTGPKCAQFEHEFAQFVGASHALAVNSATAGLHLELEAAGVKSGDTVVTTPYTFTATAEVIRYLDADPLFCDIDARTLNIDVEKLRALVENYSGRITAIIPVHFGGQACDMDPILSIARKHSLSVVEDAAHALPTTYNGKKIGTIGDITVFSFYVTKTITTGEGGMISTDNAQYAERMRSMRLHGISRDVFKRYTDTKPSWYYEVVAPGFKYNMMDLAAAIGIHQLRKAEQFRRRREEIANTYNEAFEDLPMKVPHKKEKTNTHAWHLYVIQLELERLTIDRDRFIELMYQHDVGTSVHFIPLHLHPFWKRRYNLTTNDYSVATDVYRRAVSLPIYPRMTDHDVDKVIESVRKILRSHRR